jgi:hypothetical protein
METFRAALEQAGQLGNSSMVATYQRERETFEMAPLQSPNVNLSTDLFRLVDVAHDAHLDSPPPGLQLLLSSKSSTPQPLNSSSSPLRLAACRSWVSQ